MTGVEQASVLHETTSGLESTGQTYELVRTYAVTVRPAVEGFASELRKVRVTVHVDNYVDQCRYVADVWTAGGWTQVVRINGDDPEFSVKRLNREPAVSGYTRELGAKAGFVERVAFALLERAGQVLS